MDGLELDGLSEEEKNIILSVMRRDEELRQKQENRVSQVKQEVQDLRMKSALRNGDDLSKVCARCKAPFGFLVNSGEMCPVCRFKVCKDCRATLLNQNGWMCTLCFKENQLRWLSGKWMTDEQKATRDSDSETASTASAQDQHTTGDADHDDEERAITKPVGQQDKSSDREKEVGRLSSQEEEDAEGGGGDSAYSTAGSVTTSVHTDHHLDDTDFNDSRHTLSESVEEFNPVVEVADDSIDDVPSLPEAYAQSEQNSSEAKDVQSTGEDVTHAQAGHDNNFVLGDKQAKEERDSGIGCDEETSVNQCQELPQTEQNEAADTAVVSSSGAVVPTLEEQIAEVQKMRSPESNLSYTMQRYFLVDDNGSDTLSIISERTEPEDKGEVTDAEGTIQTDSDSDSEGTVHDDLDGHWSDDSNDVLEAGTTTPRRLSVSELDVVAAGDLQSSGTNDSKSCESQTEIIPATPENDKAEVQMSAHQSEPSIKQSPQGDLTETLSPAKCSEENPSVETDIQVVNFEHPDNKIDASTECVPEEGKLSRITLLENSSTQTEEILFISKDYEDLWRELLTHHEGGKQRLYRSYSEDWTQTDFPTEDINDTDKYQSEQDEAQKLTQNGKLEKEDSCLDIESDGQSEIQLDNRQDRPDITDHSSHITQTKESLPDTSSADCVLSNTRAAEDPDTCEKESISVSLTSEVMVLHQENKVPIQNMDEVQADNTDDRPYLHGDSSRPTTNNEENSNVETSDLQGISRTSSPDCILPVYEENPENDEVIRTPSPDYSPDIPEVINPDAVETRTTPSPDYLPDALVDLDDLPISGETDNVLGTQPTKKGTEVEMHHPATPQLLNGTVVATSDQSDSAVETASSQGQNIAESPRGSDRRFPSSALPSSKAGSTEELDRNEEDNVDQLFAKHKRVDHLNGSRISIAGSRESLASVYSDAGEINYGRIPVTGEITFGLEYDQKASALKIHIKHCHDLAPVDTKHNRSDPYVKVYLLPDKTRSGKRKSKIKKHTLNPVYNETLSYNISSGELETRTLWVTVWHSDRFGRNDFLGEVSFPIDMEIFRDPTPQTYYLESRIPEPSTDSSLQYKGDLVLSLMYVTADKVKEDKLKSKSKSKKSKAAAESQGEIRVMIKSAKNLTAVRSSGSSDPFVKGYLLPDRGRTRKQKTPVVKNSVNPMWNHILVFENVDPNDIAERSLELTVWDHEKLGTNEFLGGAQLNLGLGTKEGQPVDWMDAKGEEVLVWQNIIEQANTWFDAQLLLRPSMGKCSSKK